ncbi:uncharacterized protein LOC110027133 isoform X2 [Phalaenopsis equestris]|uniref:uncharacterized protein LOC110027133 isoform X2 n=1 Tax=Phalaenopsis equestris TaxID=78828 RepID=UPI0009E292D9|nr:uncharacterized protein LOC110027133 isoform X2 [Phalaenopsis equestris]
MRILNWVQTKLNRRPEKKTSQSVCFSSLYPPQPKIHTDEFMGWPHGLLAIGTLNSICSIREEEQTHHHHPLPSSQSSNDVSDFTVEEAMKQQKELTKLLKSKPKSFNNGSATGEENANLLLNRLLNCPSNLLIRLSEDLDEDLERDDGDLSPNSNIIRKKVRDFLIADNRSIVGQKSVACLLKKLFFCKGGFGPASGLRDPIIVSRMEKLLRIMVYKKIFPQSSAAVTVNKCLENNKLGERVACKDKSEEKDGRRFKWDKTDSDFIILEM